MIPALVFALPAVTAIAQAASSVGFASTQSPLRPVSRRALRASRQVVLFRGEFSFSPSAFRGGLSGGVRLADSKSRPSSESGERDRDCAGSPPD
jgi:hypothetical protein